MATKIESVSGNGTQDVEVRTPCTCGAKRWFLCNCASIIAVYEVDVFDTIVDKAQIAQIHAAHPGADLIY